MTFKQYIKLNMPTIRYAFKFCSILFAIIAAGMAIAFSFKENFSNGHPIEVFLYSLAFEYSMAIMVVGLGLWFGYVRAKKLYRIIAQIP